MTSHTIKRMVAACAVAMLFGCETVPELIDQSNDTGHTTAGLDYRDFNRAVDEAIKSMLASGAVNHPGVGRYVLAIGRIINKTTGDIDPDQLIKKIRIALLQSGKVVVTTKYRLGGSEDEMTNIAQQELGVQNQSVNPDLSLSGKIIGTAKYYDSSTQRVEYYLQLTLTDLKTGLALWEGETPIVKSMSSKTVTW